MAQELNRLKSPIDKFQTNELLAQNGFKVAQHYKLTEEEWRNNPSAEEKIQKNLILDYCQTGR